MQWQNDPITTLLLQAIESRITELYLSLVKTQFDENYDLRIAETRGKILELQSIVNITDLKEKLLDKHVEWEY